MWCDGDNWQLGHWLTGRVSDAPLSEAVIKMMGGFGFDVFDAGQLSGSMAGYVIDRVMSARDALQPLETAFFFDSFESEGRLRFAHRGRAGSCMGLSPDELVEIRAGAALYELTRAQETDLPRSAQVTFIDGDRDYIQATAEGRRISRQRLRASPRRGCRIVPPPHQAARQHCAAMGRSPGAGSPGHRANAGASACRPRGWRSTRQTS